MEVTMKVLKEDYPKFSSKSRLVLMHYSEFQFPFEFDVNTSNLLPYGYFLSSYLHKLYFSSFMLMTCLLWCCLDSPHDPQVLNLFVCIIDPLLYLSWKGLLHLIFFSFLYPKIKLKIKGRSITKVLGLI